MLAEWRKAGGLSAALKWFKVMASDVMGKDDAGECLSPHSCVVDGRRT